jgi:hypothetical protein
MTDYSDKKSEYIEQELTKIREQEAEKKLLYDRSIGSKNNEPTLKPSDEFIEKHVGKLKSEKEVQAEAQKKVDERINKERILKRKKQIQNKFENGRSDKERDR